MKKVKEMSGTERIAYRNIKGIFNWEVGGWYNCIQDHCEECIPDTVEDAKEIEKMLYDLFYAMQEALLQAEKED